MSLDLYYNLASHPCRAILLTAKCLGLQLNLKLIDLDKGDQFNPEFLKLNPLHQIPVLVDNGFVMVESRAIIQYLANAYATEKNQSIYPKDPKKRYLVDKILNFDLGNLYSSFADLYYPIIFSQAKFDPLKEKKLNENLTHLQGFLDENIYSAGNELTIADFVLIASLTSINTVHPLINFPTIMSYIDRCKDNMIGYKEANQDGLQDFEHWAKNGMKNSTCTT